MVFYYIAVLIVISQLSEVISMGEKMYKICEGVKFAYDTSKNVVYYIATGGKTGAKLLCNDDDWVELSTFKIHKCDDKLFLEDASDEFFNANDNSLCDDFFTHGDNHYDGYSTRLIRIEDDVVIVDEEAKEIVLTYPVK